MLHRRTAAGRLAALAAGLALLAAAPLRADPPAGLFEATEAVFAACAARGEQARLLDGYETSIDLNGDGLDDYLTDRGRVACGDEEGALCGEDGCAIDLWLSLSNGMYIPINLTRAIRHDLIRPVGGKGLPRLRTIHSGVACTEAGLDSSVCSRIWSFVGGSPESSAFERPPALRPAPRPAPRPVDPNEAAAAISATVSQPPGWTLRAAADGSRVALGTGPGNLMSLGAFCLLDMPFLVLRFREQPQEAEITVSFGFSSGPMEVKALFEPSAGGAFVIDLAPNRLAAELAGSDSAVDLLIDGRAAGSLSLAGSTASIRAALAGCYAF